MSLYKSIVQIACETKSWDLLTKVVKKNQMSVILQEYPDFVHDIMLYGSKAKAFSGIKHESYAMLIDLCICTMKDLDVPNRVGAPLLHITAKYGDFTRVKLLLSRGANPNNLDVNGNTLMHILAKNSYTESIVEFALEYGARADITNPQSKKTALDEVTFKPKIFWALITEYNGRDTY